MIDQFVLGLGAWGWIVLGFVLLILEIAIPGIFFLWIGIAALLVGLVAVLPGAVGFVWQFQVIAFLILAVASVLVGRRVMAAGAGATDLPFLNRRAEQLVGQVATLGEPIVDGRGRVKLGDTMWRVTGPELPAGTRVRVAATKDETTLVVEPLTGV